MKAKRTVKTQRAKVVRRTPKRKAAAPARKSVRSSGAAAGLKSEQLARLQEQLREAQETLSAIQSGAVDAVVVSGSRGSQIYSLSSAEQPYRVYVEQMAEGAVTVGAEGLVLFCNQRFADMLHTPLERVIGANLFTWLSPEAWQTVAAVLKSDSQKIIKCETSLARAGRSPLLVHLGASRLHLGEQDVICLVVSDWTDHQEKAELRLAKEVAERANATKDAFLAALSHELRTPLTPVLMTATALEKDASLPEKTRLELGMMRRNVELEARLIDDLLDLTRIAQGKLELHYAPLELHAVLQRAVEICRGDSDLKSQKVHLQLDAHSQATEGDPVRIQQAIWNLVRNAVKFTPANGNITIRTSNSPDGQMVIEVQDTGIGFDADVGEKLFRAFEQGGKNITRQFGGLGLGLTITRSIMEAHGGMVEGISAGPGKGATFVLRLPVRNGHAKGKKAEPSAPPLEPKGLRLLLVEDHSDTRKSMEFLLARNKHLIKSAGTAGEALALADAHEFDLVISDLGLPDQSGLELMRQLRDRHGLRGIGVSGYGMEEDLAQSRAAGFVCHLTKPVSIDQLRQAISEVMARQ